MLKFIGLPVLSLVFASCLALPSQAQDFPTGTVRIVVPFAPGGATDTVARIIADQLQMQWKHPVILEHKPGAGTTIGADFVAKSPPNGHTIGLVNSAFPLNPFLRKKMPYDTAKDFKPVSLVGGIHSALAARPDAPFNNVKEMVAYARANPGKLNYGLSAVGSLGHLTVELLKHQERLEIVNIPFKGGAQVMNEMAAGRVDIASDSFTVMLPHIKSGKLKLLGTLGEKRVPGYDYPTVAETLPGLSAESGTGLVVPSGTPDAVVQKISADVAKVVAQPAVRKRLEELGIEVVGSTPAQFEDYLRSVSAKWGKLIAEQNIVLD
ncbi:Bug family tripartite tricarboxylate transporter substrate binding protein [Variovorax sp. VNK109]|jgi:tripartite-type tricarboxylate transporter receptor subunit TctC|uniref:Bug family tripartite tricarboxylate transporter substrate binding protein n=1 Tax=Variovorax sp. VNK109 TaxID=3400919 RepID=UPI003C03FE9E